MRTRFLQLLIYLLIATCWAPSLFAQTQSFDLLFEDFVLSGHGNDITQQESRCFQQGDDDDNTLGLIDGEGEEWLLVCNRCRNGIYRFARQSRAPDFFPFERSDAIYGGPTAMAECLERMDQVRENLTDLKASRIEIEGPQSLNDSSKGTITEVFTSFNLTIEVLETASESRNLSSSFNFKVVANILDSSKTDPLPPEEFRRFLVLLGTYRRLLERRLEACAKNSSCSGDLLSEAREYNNWIRKNVGKVDELASSTNLLNFNTTDFYNQIVPDPRDDSPLDMVEQLFFEQAKIGGMQRQIRDTDKEIKAKKREEVLAERWNADPAFREMVARDVFASCRDLRGQASTEVQQTSADLLMRLNEGLPPGSRPNFSQVFFGYVDAGIIAPFTKTKRLKETCSELVQASVPLVDDAREVLPALRKHAKKIAETLNSRIDVVNTMCAGIKPVVDEMKARFEVVEEAAETAADFWVDSDEETDEDVDTLSRTRAAGDLYADELALYLAAEGEYADLYRYPPVELARYAFLHLFEDVTGEDGTTIPSPMSTLSAAPRFGKRASFESLSGDFIFNCLTKGEHAVDRPKEPTWEPSRSSFSPTSTLMVRKSKHLTELDVLVSVNQISQSLDKTLLRMENDLKVCAAGPQEELETDLGCTLSPNDGLEVREDERHRRWVRMVCNEPKQEEIRLANSIANNRRLEVISKYVTSSPTLVMNYITQGNDDPVNLSVLCDSLLARHERWLRVQHLHNNADLYTFGLLLGTVGGGVTAFVMGGAAFQVAYEDARLSIREFLRINPEKALTQVETLIGDDPLYADALRRYKGANQKNELMSVGWNALTAGLVAMSYVRIGKSIIKKPKSYKKLPEKKLPKKDFNTQVSEGLHTSEIHQGLWGKSRNLASRIVVGINRRLKRKLLGPIAERYLARAFMGGRSFTLTFRQFADCIKHASRTRSLTIKNLVHVKQINSVQGRPRLRFKFKVGDNVKYVDQTVRPDELRLLKGQWGSDPKRWLDSHLANTSKTVQEFKTLSLKLGRYPANTTDKFFQVEYNLLKYTPKQLVAQSVPVAKPHPKNMTPMQKIWTPAEWGNKQLPLPPKIVGERSKYVDNAVLAFLSDLLIRNYTAYDSYKDMRGDQEFSWWAVGPDIAGNVFKAGVPYIGIKKMDSRINSMEFGYPDKTRYVKEQFQMAKASYLPTVRFNAVIEAANNQLYKGSNDVTKNYGDVNLENEVATARYLSAMSWNAGPGILMKSFVWGAMQGATCMIPNTNWIVKLLMKKGVFKAAQFSAAMGLSYTYANVTSDWFFQIRNFTLHSMDLYTKSEVAKQMPLKDVVMPEEFSSLGDLGLAPEDEVTFAESRAVIDTNYDDELPLELEWAPISPEGEAPLGSNN